MDANTFKTMAGWFEELPRPDLATEWEQRAARIEKPPYSYRPDDEVPALFRTLAEEYRQRHPQETFIRLKEDAPEWMRDFVREAHGTDRLPDDWRYRWVREACEFLAEGWDANAVEIDADEFADGVDVYNEDLLSWLSSNLTRVGYVDEAIEEYGNGTSWGLMQVIRLGQAAERREVFDNVIRAAEQFADV